MGHMHITKQSKMFIKRIYAKGKTTIKKLTDESIAKGITVDCSEGSYTDRGMHTWAFMDTIRWHAREYDEYQDIDVVPVLLTPKEHEVYERWNEGKMEEEADYQTFEQIAWKFATGARKRYLAGQIRFAPTCTS